jgi:hypothetical protein
MKNPLAALCCAASLAGCSHSAQADTSARFFQCWGFRGAGAGQYEVDFQAIVYPRDGVLSYNASCPRLRLQMIFNDTPTPPGFDGFRRADENRFELIGIRGRAIVSVARQEDPDVVTVTVRRLVSGEVLNDDETRRLTAAMAH